MSLQKVTVDDMYGTPDMFATPEMTRSASPYALKSAAATKVQLAAKAAAVIAGRGTMETAAPFPEFSPEALARMVNKGNATFPTLRECDL